MLLNQKEFTGGKYERIQVISNTDSGLFAVQYGPDSKTPTPTLDKSFDYYYAGDTYRLRIPKPIQREVWRTMIVSRTSANHYEIAYADTLGCAYATVNTLSAVHEFLEPLWQRKL